MSEGAAALPARRRRVPRTHGPALTPHFTLGDDRAATFRTIDRARMPHQPGPCRSISAEREAYGVGFT